MENLGLLQECKLQLEYLNEKFGETGTTNSLLSKLSQALHKHNIMQAEGSDGAKKAAVASERVEKSVCADDDHDIMSGPHYDYCRKCYKKF